MDADGTLRLEQIELNDPEAEGVTEDNGARSQALAANPSSSAHTYSVVHLHGNSRAILGNVGRMDNGFFPNLGAADSNKLLLNALYFEGMQSRKQQISLRAGSPKYIEWVWSTSFRTWLESAESFYWITGRPGSGKSTLMKHISESQKTRKALEVSGDSWMVVHFFFDFRASNKLANTVQGMLRALLYQIVKQCPAVADSVGYTSSGDSPGQIDLHDCMESLCEAIRSASKKVCAFIDGLDEYDGPGADLLEVIFGLEDRSGLKICMASRPYPVFKDDLSSFRYLVVQDHNEESIKLYTEAQCKSNRLVGKTSLPQQLNERIREKAKGVFLWARLATDEMFRGLLAGKPVEYLEEQLNQMPEEVEQMYQRVLDRLPRVLQMEAAMLLYMIIASAEPVEVRKLYVAMKSLTARLSIQNTIQPIDECEDYDVRILALLGDLLDISVRNPAYDLVYEKGQLRYQEVAASEAVLTHETLYSYLTKANWLDDTLKPYVYIKGKDSFWSDLYLDELSDSLHNCETLPPTVLERFAVCIAKLERTCAPHLENDEDSENRSGDHASQDYLDENEAIRLLECWKAWTPLLPYALREVLENTATPRKAFQRWSDLRRITLSSLFSIHRVICLIRTVGIPFDTFKNYFWYYAIGHDDKCCFLPANNIKNFWKLLRQDLFVGVSHNLPLLASLSLKKHVSISRSEQQLIFDACWQRFLLLKDVSGSNIRDWESVLEALVALGSRVKLKHFCRIFVHPQVSSLMVLPHVPEFLLRHLGSSHLEHDGFCQFRKDPNSEAGFLQHWIKLSIVSQSNMSPLSRLFPTLFQALNTTPDDLNHVENSDDETVLNQLLIEKGKHGSGRSSKMIKLIIMIQAGADPQLKGRSGTAIDAAKQLFRWLLDGTKYSPKREYSDERLQEAVKIIGLLQYYDDNDSKLPDNLEDFLKHDFPAPSG